MCLLSGALATDTIFKSHLMREVDIEWAALGSLLVFTWFYIRHSICDPLVMSASSVPLLTVLTKLIYDKPSECA